MLVSAPSLDAMFRIRNAFTITKCYNCVGLILRKQLWQKMRRLYILIREKVERYYVSSVDVAQPSRFSDRPPVFLLCSQYVPPRRQVVIDFDVIDRNGLSQLPDSPPRPASSPVPGPGAESCQGRVRVESARRDLARLLSGESGESESGQ